MKGRSKRFSTVAISVIVAVVLLAGTAVAAGIQIQQRDRDRTSYPHDEDRPINQYTQAPSSGAAAPDAVEAVCDGGAAGETPVAYVGIEKRDRDRINYPFGDDDNGSQGMQAQLQEQTREQTRTCETGMFHGAGEGTHARPGKGRQLRRGPRSGQPGAIAGAGEGTHTRPV